MISGHVNASREPIITISVKGPDERESSIEAVIDTGFNGHLILPSQLIRRLGLSRLGSAGADLADGSRVSLDLFEATVLWDGKERPVAVLQTENEALLGMSMLTGHRLTLDVVSGGEVRIETLTVS